MNKKIYPLIIALCALNGASIFQLHSKHKHESANEKVVTLVSGADVQAADVYLTTPGNNAYATNIIGKFKCKTVASATSYTLEVSERNDFSDGVLTYTTSNGEFNIDNGLRYAKTYYARIKTDLSPAYGITTIFKTRDVEYYAFVSQPGNGVADAEVVDARVTANLIIGALYYTIDLSVKPDFSDSVWTKTSSTQGQRTLFFERLPYARKIYGRVKSDISGYGKVTTFTTRAEPLVTIAKPVAGSTIKDRTKPLIIVNAIAKAKSFTIEVSTSSDFTNSFTKNSLEANQTQFLLQELQPSTTYYVRARSDVSTKWGPSANFHTPDAVAAKRLWGLTTVGGAYDAGTLFSFSLDSLHFIKHADHQPEEEGALFTGGLVADSKGRLIGNSTYSPTGDGGRVFTYDPSTNSLKYLNSYIHKGSVMLASNNYLYVVHDWINTFRGGIYRMRETDSVFDISSVIFRFRSDFQGVNPQAQLLEKDGYVYGSAPYQGAGKKGTLFRLKLDGSGFQVVHTFTNADGANPDASLIAGDDGFLYGVTPRGGATGKGVVFKVSPDGSSYSKLLDFNGSNGAYPRGRLTLVNNTLYGVASEGGVFNKGVLFSVNTDGSGFTKLLDFNGANGAVPLGSVTPGDQATLYGFTAGGGANSYGVIYSIKTDGTNFIKLFDFSEETGYAPDGYLLLREDTFTPPVTALMASAKIDAVEVHPNPFQQSFTASIKAHDGTPVRVVITDINGSVVSDRAVTQDAFFQGGEDLRKGIYILKVIRGKDVSVKRIVKQ
jgi:uncharacterized repeat protein (TIGR03803 family)